MPAKDYPGNAVPTALATPLVDGADTTCDISATTGWPTGSSGAWVARISKGVSGKEEKILITSRSGAGLTIATRGYDGTSAVSHDAGEPIECCWDAVSAKEAADHIYNTGLDHHNQYHNTARHAAVVHLVGTHTASPAAPADPTATGSASAGAATAPARADHVHALPASIPRGYLGSGQDTDGQTGITSSDADLTNVAAAVTVGPGTRRLKVTLTLEVQQSSSLSGVIVGIWEGSTTLLEHKQSIVVSGETHTIEFCWTGTATAGSHTYKARMRAVGGGGTTAMLASTDSPAKILVEDIGV